MMRQRRPMRRSDAAGVAAALTVVVIWAASFSFARQAIEHLGPWVFRLYSMGLAIIPLLTFLKPAVTSPRALEADPARRILLSTWITGTLVATANMVALAWYPATTVLALMYTMPAFTSLLDMRRSGVWSLRSAAAPVAALLGMIMVASSGGPLHGAGTVLVLVNALLWAIGTRLAGTASALMPPQQIHRDRSFQRGEGWAPAIRSCPHLRGHRDPSDRQTASRPGGVKILGPASHLSHLAMRKMIPVI